MKPYEILKFFRKNNDLTTYKLSDLTGIPQSTISKMENGKRKITSEELQLLANALNVPVSNFFENNNENLEVKAVEPKEDIKNIISDQDKLLLEKIKSLTPEKAKAILKMIETFEEEHKDK
jgi:transcriptional regulator with XRE-family HTH domain